MDGGCGRGTERVELTGSAVLSLRVGHFRGPLPVCSACTVRDPASSAIHACSTTSTTSTPHLRCPVACVVRHQRLLTYSRACTWSSTCYSAPTTQTARAATTTVTGLRLARRPDSAYRPKKRSTWPEALAKFSADRGLSRCRRRPTPTDFDSCAPGQPGVVPPCGSAVQVFHRPKT